MNKIRVRLIIGGNYTDYYIDTKATSESGFKDAIKRELEQWGMKPLCYRFDLIVNGKAKKTKMSFSSTLDKRFLEEEKENDR